MKGHAFRRAANRSPIVGSGLQPTALLHNQLCHFRLLDVQVRLRLQQFPHLQPVLLLVALRPRRPYCRPARSIQQPKLNADRVRHLAHNAAESINFADEMSLGNPPNRRIARHLRDQIDVEREQGSLQSHARRGHGGLAARVPSTHHYDVVSFGEFH